jgi:hypothetical protein
VRNRSRRAILPRARRPPDRRWSRLGLYTDACGPIANFARQFAVRRGFGSHDVEDVVGQALLIAWQVLPRYDPDRYSDFRKYILGVLRHKLVDYMCEIRPSIEVSVPGVDPAAVPPPRRGAWDDVDLPAIEAGIAAGGRPLNGRLVPPPAFDQEAFCRVFGIYGYKRQSMKEAAESMGVTVSRVECACRRVARHFGPSTICAECKIEFIATYNGTKTCSPKCSKKHSNIGSNIRDAMRRDGQHRAAVEEGTAPVCVVCNKPYRKARPNQVTCSKKCYKANQKQFEKKRGEKRYPKLNADREGICAACGNPFRKVKANQVTCGKECRRQRKNAMDRKDYR